MIQATTETYIRRKEIAQLLAEVPDPEIPGVSIVDLGMVIDIRFQGELCVIELAPTYSGCPAIDVIPIMVMSTLRESGHSHVKVDIQISPPWSTEWISEIGKQKLFELGIAPPNKNSRQEEDEGRPKQCPQCGSEKTILISRFSSTPCKAAYRCTVCQEPFEYFKCY
ncbi:MAG TPA: 1,2-phenylacetyl-CoA epoxidase subunit PaaD [Saprospiraceae bacterium]|nr:1,2-phenylacetyl-CoA epoxidase subunit PaaD [Saprospiraceae bacterium]